MVFDFFSDFPINIGLNVLKLYLILAYFATRYCTECLSPRLLSSTRGSSSPSDPRLRSAEGRGSRPGPPAGRSRAARVGPLRRRSALTLDDRPSPRAPDRARPPPRLPRRDRPAKKIGVRFWIPDRPRFARPFGMID